MVSSADYHRSVVIGLIAEVFLVLFFVCCAV